jgi:large subunit ribosomal protein L23
LRSFRRRSDSFQPPAASFPLGKRKVKLEAGSWKREAHMKLTDVIRRPLVTEKTTLIRESNRTLVFEVASSATKVDIKRAVEKLLGSKVEAVRTAISHGKMKRQGRFIGQRSDWKKAYVKLREGEKIPEFLEGA